MDLVDLEEMDINARNWDYWRILVNAALNLWVSQAMKLVII